MNNRLKRKVANDYPYPVTIDFMRLNTPDFRNPDMKRIGKIIDVTENVLHFLALIALSDLLENISNLKIPDNFKARFRGNFTRTSLGKWGELLREVIKLFKIAGVSMFIEELPDFFIKGKTGESVAQSAFNRITSIRNKLQHKDKHYSRAEIETTCKELEELLETFLEEMNFIVDYPFLYVNKITVDYHRWSDPKYEINLSNIIGSNPELFDSKIEKSSNLMNTPAVIVTKENPNVYLNLEPLIIYSDEGNLNIPDIFMYMDWEKGKTIKYKPIWKGGTFNLIETSDNDVLSDGLLKFFKNFALEEDYESFNDSLKEKN
jgi:hypothetical protein